MYIRYDFSILSLNQCVHKSVHEANFLKTYIIQNTPLGSIQFL